MANAAIDQNHKPSLIAVSNMDGVTPVVIYADPVTHRLLVDASGGAGVTSVATDNTLTGGPITSTGTLGLNLANANAWTALQTFNPLPQSSATPSNPSDLVTKVYVDSIAQGLTVKQSVIVATTANITLSGEQTIDGVLTSTSRVLVKNQTLGQDNGIYVSSAGAWARATDYDTSLEAQAGTFMAVIQGTTQANQLWVQTVQNPTLGTTPLVFTQLSSTGTGSVTSVSVKPKSFTAYLTAFNTFL